VAETLQHLTVASGVLNWERADKSNIILAASKKNLKNAILTDKSLNKYLREQISAKCFVFILYNF